MTEYENLPTLKTIKLFTQQLKHALSQQDLSGYTPTKPLLIVVNNWGCRPSTLAQFCTSRDYKRKIQRLILSAACMNPQYPKLLSDLSKIQTREKIDCKQEKLVYREHDFVKAFGERGPLVRADGLGGTGYFHNCITHIFLHWLQRENVYPIDLEQYYSDHKDSFKPKVIPNPDLEISDRCWRAYVSLNKHLDSLAPKPVSMASVSYMFLYKRIVEALFGLPISRLKTLIGVREYISNEKWWMFLNKDCMEMLAGAFEQAPQWLHSLDDLADIGTWTEVWRQQHYPITPQLSQGPILLRSAV